MNAIEVIPANDTSIAITNLATDLAANFIHDGEKWVIDTANPPTLEQSYILTEKILTFKKSASNISDQSSWLIGNIVMMCRNYFNDDFDITQIGDVMGSSYNTLITAEAVYLFFGDRRIEELSFTHHKEVYYTKGLTDEQKFLTLEMAKKYNLTAKKTRKLASFIKNKGPDILFEELEDLDLHNRLDEYKKETIGTFITISYDEQVKKVKETDMNNDIVNRSRIILDPELQLIKMDLEHE